MDQYLDNSALCQQACMRDLSVYLKVLGDFTIAKDSLIEAINSLQSHGCYASLINADQQTKISNVLTTLNNLVLE